MRLLPRRPSAASVEERPVADVLEPSSLASSAPSKGRPTPKRRDADPRRGPVAAPKSRKEAVQRHRQQMKQSRQPTASLTPQQRRQRMLAGDPTAFSARDAGPVRELARDYVDSRRMFSNGLLILFPLVALSFLFRTPLVSYAIVALFAAFAVEWTVTGRRIVALANERGIDTGGRAARGIGFYAGQRAYLPRKWRVPRPRVGLGDEI